MTADERTDGARRVVVTGASTGIGEAAVRRFRERGWLVTAVARRQERLAPLAAETGCDFVVADLTLPEDVDRVREAVDAGGDLHALVNNAGGARGLDPVETGDIDDWRWMFEANVVTTKQITASLLPALRRGAAATGNADILTVTSTAARDVYAGGGGYNAAKAAERALVGVLRLELAGEPIRVIELAPGMVRTEEFSLNRFGGDASRADAVYEGVEAPLTAEDVAERIVDSVELPGHVNLDLVVVKPVAQITVWQTVRGPLRVKE